MRCPSAQPLQLHQLEPRVGARGLPRVRPPAHDDRRTYRGAAVHDRAGGAPPRRRPRGADAPGSRERQMYAAQARESAGAQPDHRRLERPDQLVGRLVAAVPVADAAVDDLLQLVAARERFGPSPCRCARWRRRRSASRAAARSGTRRRGPASAACHATRNSFGATNGFIVRATTPRRSSCCRAIPKSRA